MHENKDDIYGWSVHFETLSSGIIFKFDWAKELKNVIRLGQEVGHGGDSLVVRSISFSLSAPAAKNKNPSLQLWRLFAIVD